MSTTFYAGNERTLLIKKQVDKDTEITDWSDAMALRVYDLSRIPVRTIQSLAETDKSAQQGASKVATIAAGLTWGMYGRPSELDLIAELLLGADDDSATTSPTTHEATPDQDSPYFGVLDVYPYGTTCARYNGCRFAGGQFETQDEGDTFLKVTGLQALAMGVTYGVTKPSPVPDPVDEDPFIHAELAVSYASVHPGTTKAATVTITRNTIRAQGDSGFTALDIVHGKFQVDGSVSLYIGDDGKRRLVDTGSPTGTDPTATVPQEALSLVWSRGSAGSARSFTITSQGISYETHEDAVDASNGNPYVEVLGFRTQPQSDIADNIAMLTVNDKSTTESAPGA